ncbi:MAG: hypothetical protein FD180_4135 [Planctomycetota bacterium]|nr:MAG: hypothetical protein FD180_4135 [Planctomycetota bacterium]
MRIHPSHVTETEIAERQRLGLDMRDEEWEGVYHVTPSPSLGHQMVFAGLIQFLRALLEWRGGGTIVPEFNVFRQDVPERDYRIPDILFVAAGREGIIARDGIRGGAPDVVFEILSPRDESYAKLSFYAAIGVPEVIIVEPDSRSAEVWKLGGGTYSRRSPEIDGTLVSERLEVSFRTIEGDQPRLEVADRRDPQRRLSV